MSAQPQKVIAELGQIREPENPKLLNGVDTELELAGAVTVEDQESYALADAALAQVKRNIRELEDLRVYQKAPSLEAGRRVDAFFKPFIDKWHRVAGHYSAPMLAYRQKVQREQDAEQARQRRQREEAQRQQEAESLRQAEAAEQRGDHEARQQHLQAAAAPVVMPATVPTVAPVVSQHSSARKVWRFEVADRDALVKAAAAGHPLAKTCVMPDETTIGKLVRAQEDQCSIPGVRVWAEETLASKGSRR